MKYLKIRPYFLSLNINFLTKKHFHELKINIIDR